jgi:hypothetical protein
MISGVAVVDDTGHSSGVPEIKSALETGADPQSPRRGNATSRPDADRDDAVRTAVNPFDGFGDRFSTESAQTLLDAQETLPAPPSRPRAAPTGTDDDGSASRDGEDAAATDINPLDTDQDGMVSFVEWLQSQDDGADLTGQIGNAPR